MRIRESLGGASNTCEGRFRHRMWPRKPKCTICDKGLAAKKAAHASRLKRRADLRLRAVDAQVQVVVVLRDLLEAAGDERMLLQQLTDVRVVDELHALGAAIGHARGRSE
mmetsp:Transcript_30445/g.70626  ORF Transcript_30445/g.70626 Transcript_30445/m.70626 type:complete len:110 (-) Transcript_30445:487-816(-)